MRTIKKKQKQINFYYVFIHITKIEVKAKLI